MFKTLLSLSLFLAIPLWANPTTVANLYRDLSRTNFAKATTGVSTFKTNHWIFWEGFKGTKQLKYSIILGTDNAAGFGGTGANQVPLVSLEGAFDGNLPKAGEVTLHPRNGSGPSSDLVLRWTANKAYKNVIISHAFRNPKSESSAYALSINEAKPINIIEKITKYRMTGSTNSKVIPALANLSKGDTIEIIIFNNGNYAGDQTFGNFTIKAKPVTSTRAI